MVAASGVFRILVRGGDHNDSQMLVHEVLKVDSER